MKNKIFKLKTQKKPSSARWLLRHLNDPYAQKAQMAGYRSRSAFKLKEIQEKFSILRPGMRALDLGAAPGGWTQVLVEEVSPHRHEDSCVVSVDLLPMEAIDGAYCIQGDFEQMEANISAIAQTYHAIVSDMAPSTTGNSITDRLRMIHILEIAWEFAKCHLVQGGSFVAKHFQGGLCPRLTQEFKESFHSVRHVKLEATHKDSTERYVVALGFRTQERTQDTGATPKL